MANILLKYAMNKEYYLEIGSLYHSNIYARLSHAYLRGIGLRKNSDLAWHYLRTAVELGVYSSELICNQRIFHVIKDNVSEVYEMALKQSENNDKCADIILGILHLGGVILLEETNEGDKKVYLSLFEDLFDLSDSSWYNENLSIGTVIVPMDYKKALKYFSKAGDTGDSYAKLVVGFMYHCGYGTKQNFTKASECYQSLLSDVVFDSIAKPCLGYLYACGEGVKFDNDLALNHSKVISINKSHLFNIAQILYYGDEAIRNHKTSFKYLVMAASRPCVKSLSLIKKVNDSDLNGRSNSTNGAYSIVSGRVVDGEVEYLLGIMYEKGQGTRINYKEAFDRLSKAAKCGNKRAENHLNLHYKDKKFIK